VTLLGTGLILPAQHFDAALHECDCTGEHLLLELDSEDFFTQGVDPLESSVEHGLELLTKVQLRHDDQRKSGGGSCFRTGEWSRKWASGG
jgi:hypothetical protein